MNFFGPNVWCGKQIVFPNDPNVVWATFSCKREDDLKDKHAVKIYMQAPWIDAEFTSAAARKAQTDTNRSIFMASEINALRKFAENRANNAPHLVAELHTKQSDDGIIPTGFISYILTTWCPGVPLGDAFEEALGDTKRCGIVSYGPKPDDLLWDAANKKCYMANFQWSGPPRSFDIAEQAWRRWRLQPGPPNHMLVKVILKGLVRDNPMGNVSSLWQKVVNTSCTKSGDSLPRE
ncbi:uncharacterized protein TRUGW13939_10756 [Talaromyces rugulosus]|uniref:Uncharacterized protein n=1 Tax=Talaromyces rugulosus TaxID=121627 RepID=A0A7H8RDI7_TALRU|nr:uncharacterized protein TRUGW13939_10756 [Talaromyces rugulosus]QKX63585.1 hypothetical protein TRUGW13939_10756 [Talaromyces rugulosus]